MSEANQKPILVLLTGGTICSMADEKQENFSAAHTVRAHILRVFSESSSPHAKTSLETVTLSEDVLSENMTVSVWNQILEILRDERIPRDYAGVILLHGTDTLAYTAAMLAMAMAGTPIPILLVSAQLALSEKETNGHANFRAAVELIRNGIAPNVYAVYRNMTDEQDPRSPAKELLLHLGAHLRQCENDNHNFYSADAWRIPNTENACCAGIATPIGDMPLRRMSCLTPCVLQIEPYVGLDYARLSREGVTAILHGTYHSQTVCAKSSADTHSILWLLGVCRQEKIPVYLLPCDPACYTYVTTGDALRAGAVGLCGMTREAAYAKLLVGSALGLRGDALTAFLREPLNGEYI